FRAPLQWDKCGGVEDNMKKFWSVFWELFLILGLLVGVSCAIWRLGQYFSWDWGGFWSNFISNAGSSAVIGFVLYWIITRPDEKKAANQRRAQALSMLKIEFSTNLTRAKRYREALKTPENDLTPIYPLRFTRGAWNALRESGFLLQFDDVGFVYELLRLNEIIVVANRSLSSVRSAKVEKNAEAKLTRSSKKAVKECAQIESYLDPILAKLEKMKLPKITLPVDVDDDNDNEPDEGNDLEGKGENDGK
ncbi:MAG: hypothetical protein AB6733_24120, partial [Clostridiaceae bacterium]